jgi:O-antigen/teichoic acid export membrane protein
MSSDPLHYPPPSTTLARAVPSPSSGTGLDISGSEPELLAPPVGVDAGFKRLLRSSAWLLTANSLALGLGFAQLIVVARVLGPHAYGILALITTYTAAANQLLDSRAWEAATSYLVRYRAEGNLVKAAAVVKLCYLIDAGTALLALLLVAVTAPWASRVLLHDPSRVGLLLAFAVTIVAGAPAGTSLVLLRVAGRFRSVAFQNTLSAALRFVAVVTAVFLAGTIESVIWAQVAAAGVSAGCMLWMGRRGAGSLGLGGLGRIFRAPLGILRRDLRGIVRFLAVTNASGLLKLAQRNGDVLLVGYLLGPAQAGFVKLARSFSDLMNLPVAPVYEASYPAFASHWRLGQLRELRALARRVTASSSLVAFAGVVTLLILAGPLIRWTAGAQYAPAVAPLQWFAIAMGLAVATSAWHPLLLAVDRPGRSLLALAAGVSVQLAILLLGLPALGIAAAGLASIGFYLVWTGVVGHGLLKLSSHHA